VTVYVLYSSLQVVTIARVPPGTWEYWKFSSF